MNFKDILVHIDHRITCQARLGSLQKRCLAVDVRC